jgi:hypothetical protein
MPDQRTYPSNINVPRITQALKDHFMPQGFQTQEVGAPPHLMFQMAHKGALASATGTARAITIQFEQKPNEVIISLGEQKWVDKAAVGVVGLILWPLLVTAAYGAWKQSELPEEIWHVIDSNAYTPTYGAPQATPPTYVPPPPSPPTAAPAPPGEQSSQQPSQGPRFCPDCGTKNPGSKFCPNCGKQLY